jgi:hypothetical protein
MAFARFTRMDWTNPDDPTLDRPIDVNPAHIAHYSEDTLHGHIATNNLYAKHPKHHENLARRTEVDHAAQSG